MMVPTVFCSIGCSQVYQWIPWNHLWQKLVVEQSTRVGSGLCVELSRPWVGEPRWRDLPSCPLRWIHKNKTVLRFKHSNKRWSKKTYVSFCSLTGFVWVLYGFVNMSQIFHPFPSNLGFFFNTLTGCWTPRRGCRLENIFEEGNGR